MTVPPHIQPWVDAMNASPETSQVLQNLLNETCLDTADEQEFWLRVENAGVPADSFVAWENAQTSVWQAPSLNRKRNEVPSSHFDKLVRFTLPAKLPFMFPTLDLTSTGLTIAALDTASHAEIQELLDEAATINRVDFQFLVWVAEQSPELDAIRPRAAELMDRLGLRVHHAQIVRGGCCVEIQYDRTSLPAATTLHVPSALDGIDNDQFRPRTPCSLPFGTTEPLNPASGTGLPEAVHEGCVVMNFDVKLLTL